MDRRRELWQGSQRPKQRSWRRLPQGRRKSSSSSPWRRRGIFFFSVPFETRFQGDGCSECLCLLCDFIGTLSMKEWVAKGIYKVAKSHFQEVCNGNYRGQRLERRHVFGAARSAECQRGDSHGIWGSRCQAIWTSSIVPCASVEKTSNIQTVQWLNNWLLDFEGDH